MVSIYEISKEAAGIIGQGCKILLLLIAFVLLLYVLKSLIKSLRKAGKEE